MSSQISQTINLDYYAILNISKDATKQDICKAYREIALRNHPSLQHQNKNLAYHIFCQASEAFDILYDNEKRNAYNQYGDQVLKQGILSNGQFLGKYKFTTEPEEVFEKFFGSSNVYDHLLDLRKQDNIDHPIFASQYSNSIAQKNRVHLIVKIQCTLTQLFNGCMKTVTYDKNILSSDGQEIKHVKQTKTIEILPGSSPKTDIIFKSQGHKEPGYSQSDLIFKITEIPQKRFKRQGNDLLYEQSINLMQALDSKSITITELNGQVIQLHFDQIINPQTRRIVEGKGMPIRQNPQKRGNLIVTFNIEFPESLTLENKKQIIKLIKV